MDDISRRGLIVGGLATLAASELTPIVDALDSALEACDATPAAWVPWLPSQVRFFRSKHMIRLFRAGNQSLGKTTALLTDVIWHALGEHPYRVQGRAEAGEYWIICASWSQSVAIQAKLHALLPPARVHPETVFHAVRGFRGKTPSVRVLHASGEWSLIRFRTAQQGSLDLAGATIDGAAFDEPPAEHVFSEVSKRVQARAGWVALGLTPIGAPVDWLRGLAEDGMIEDLHTPLRPAELIPVGHRLPRRLPDGTVCDAQWIAKIERETPPHEREVRVHGGWEVRVTDRYFSVFRSSGPDAHVHDRVPAGEVRLCLGIDHGTRPGKQIAPLVCVDESGEEPAIYILDEYCDDSGATTPADDARGIEAMLARHGLTWIDLDHAHGDRVHMPGSGAQKSNLELARAIAKRMKIATDALRPPLRTVKRGTGRGAGSVSVGSRWLFHAMVRPGGFGVHPRCLRTIEALDRYTMADDDYKDPVDAIRYALDPYIFSPRRGPSPTLHLV